MREILSVIIFHAPLAEVAGGKEKDGKLRFGFLENGKEEFCGAG